MFVSCRQELVLFLIQKELQGTKFLDELAQLGWENPTFRTDLGEAILSLIGFKQRSSQLWEWFCESLEKYAVKIDLKNGTQQHEIALDFYIDLQMKFRNEDANK